MFERFTDRARRVVVLAQEEARMINHNYIGTEHLLLGLLHEPDGVAHHALVSLGISLDGVRQLVEEIIGVGQQAPSGHIPFTPRAKKVCELGLREALQLGDNYVNTEHLLLGIVREGDGVAAQVLVRLGAELAVVRQQVMAVLRGTAGPVVRAPGVRLRNLSVAAREGKLDPVFVEGPAVSGLRKRYSLKPLPVIPGTHCGPPAEAGTRSLSGDAFDCSAVRCSVQYRAWPFRGSDRLCGIRALS